MKRIAIAFVLVATTGATYVRTDAPVTPRATTKDYREILQMLREVDESLADLENAVGTRAKDDGWAPDCRGYSPEKTVRCAAAAFDPPGGAEKAVAVWSCESNFGVEPPHSDAYHGPFQFLASTFLAKRESMPDVVRWYELPADVHDVRSNVLTAVAWAARNSWSPWGCA